MIESLLDRTKPPQRIISLTFFTGEQKGSEIDMIRERIDKMLVRIYRGNFYPPFLVISQPPLQNPGGILLEACLLSNRNKKVTYKGSGDARYTLVSNNNEKELYVMCQVQKGGTNTYDCYFSAFEKINNVLKKEKMRFSNVIRQWNYIGNILGYDDNSPMMYSNYAVFNKVRTVFYEKENFASGYPAATGIGMKHQGIGISVIAGNFQKNLLEPVSSCLQMNPYQYLPEKIAPGSDKMNLPKFERALILNSVEGEARIFVSGTAAIRGMNTVCKNDFIGQAGITFDNILKLIPDLLERGNEIKTDYLRVYIKRSDDLNEWQYIINHLPEIFKTGSISVLQADICRDDLLLEVECSFTRKL